MKRMLSRCFLGNTAFDITNGRGFSLMVAVALFSALVSLATAGSSMAAGNEITVLPSGVVPSGSKSDQTPLVAEPLRLQMSAGNNAASLVFQLYNDSDQPIHFLRDGTPFDDVSAGDILRILPAGKVGWNAPKAQYIGPVYRRLPATADRFLEVPPAGTLRAEIDIIANYQLPFDGRFRISYAGALFLADTDSIRARSNVMDQASTWIPEVEPVELDLQAVPFTYQPRALQPEFDACTALQQSTIETATVDAETRANDSLQSLLSTPVESRPTSPRYTTWFGTYTAPNYNFVTTVMERISSVLTNEVITYRCSPEFCSSSSTVAYVQPFLREDINLCPLFFDERVDNEFRAGTVIHELSHLLRIGNTDDLAYGSSASAILAQNSPVEALDNADNHTLFAMNNEPPLPMIADGSTGDTSPTVPVNDGEVDPGFEFFPLSGGETVRNTDLPIDNFNLFRVTNAAALELTSISGDADLYLFASEDLTEESLVCSSREFSSDSVLDSCQIVGNDEHFAVVFGFTRSSYVLEAAPLSGGGDTDVLTGAIPLAIGERATGTLGELEANIFTSIMPGRIVLTTSSGDTDLYVFNNSSLSEDSLVCRSVLIVAQDLCEIPEAGRVHIAVLGFDTASSYELAVQSLGSEPEPEPLPSDDEPPVTRASSSSGGSLDLLSLLFMAGFIVCNRYLSGTSATGRAR